MDATATCILQSVIRGLARCEQDGLVLDDYLDFELEHPDLRRTVGNILFTSFRRRARIDRTIAALAKNPPRPRVRRLLTAALTQVFYCDGIAPESAVNVAVDLARDTGGEREAGFVNAVLRRATRLAAAETGGEGGAADLPPAAAKRWKSRFPAETLDRFAELLSRPAPNSFRCRAGMELTAAELTHFSAEPEAPVTANSPWTFYRIADPAALLASDGWRAGRFYFQDPAAAAALSLVDFSRVTSALDLCAAPGGKSLLIAERLPEHGRLVAADRSEARQRLTRENFRRWGLPEARFRVLTASPWELAGDLTGFDLVLADVPCSNTGVFRRRPDALWRFSAASLAKAVELQRRILAAAAERVAVGGQLLYSTCSIEPEENERLIADFLAAHPAFEMVRECPVLPDFGHDGAYGCLLRRRSR